jgi:hypothetical protein
MSWPDRRNWGTDPPSEQASYDDKSRDASCADEDPAFHEGKAVRELGDK